MKRRFSRLWRLALATSLLLASSCAQLEIDPPEAVENDCEQRIQQAEALIEAAGVRDRQGKVLLDTPFLRADRFLASFSAENLDQAQYREWYWRAASLGLSSWLMELNNLPADQLPEPAIQGLQQCAKQQLTVQQHDVQSIQQLMTDAVIPADYRVFQRIFGLYPVSRLFLSSAVEGYRQETLAHFQSPDTRITAATPRVYYTPPHSAALPPEEIASHLDQAKAQSSLGIPQPEPEFLDKLFAHFAPAWLIEKHGPDDQVGSIRLIDEFPQVDINQPLAYTLPSYTRWNDQIHLQLNYHIWFPSRPATRFLDIYSGNLDGIIWRVTLDHDGTPLLYDSIHPCGCYHFLFPVGNRLQFKKPGWLIESPVVVPLDQPLGRPVIQVSRGAHLITGLLQGPFQSFSVPYQLEDYDNLRSLPTESGNRSLFQPNGLVKGTERLERWLLWPSGILSPGAMRQWGSHATAFTGNRHFDDADMLETLFQSTEPE